MCSDVDRFESGDMLNLLLTRCATRVADYDAIHAGCPPTGGNKWIAQQWFNLDHLAHGASAASSCNADRNVPVPAARGGEQVRQRASERALQRLREEIRTPLGRSSQESI